MNWRNIFLKKSIILLGLILIMSTRVSAEDVDIFDAEKPVAPPNVLFVMDVSGSMAWNVNDNKTAKNPALSRLNILRNALGDLLTDPDMVDINVGLMSFSGHSGNWLAHGPSYPVAPIDGDAQTILDSNPLFTHPGTSNMPVPGGRTTRGYLQQVANGWTAQNGTPIVGALFEAAKYMRGEDVYWGNQPPDRPQAAHPSTYSGLFVADGSRSSIYQCSTQACGGTTGIPCEERKTCNTTSNATTNTCQTPTCGASCTPQTYTMTCNSGIPFCGDALSAAQCTASSNPPVTHTCTDVSDAACLAANPAWQSCTLTTAGSPLSVYSCLESVPDTVTCPATQYSCSTTTNTTSCTHEICGTISTSGVKYISPITHECQSNAIILLSDGIPTVNDTSSLAASMVGAANSNQCDTASSDKGRCGPEIAKFLAEHDNNTVLAGDQFIKTYTIGFAMSANSKAALYLKSLADAGDGAFTTANSSAGLIAAFKDAISGVNNKARLFSAPTYTINKDSFLAHGDTVYLPLFNRESTPRWSGNLKKFRVRKGELLDANNQPVASRTGDMKATAKDLWATTVPDHAVKGGGVANLLDPANRQLLTDNGYSGQSAALLALNQKNVNESDLGGNTISKEEVKQLINFIRGKDASGKPRHHMGDIIHSKPVYFSFDGLSRPNKGGVIFIGTNEGYLHAFNENDGSEAFAFMPRELLKNIKVQRDNLPTQNHVYGVDGEMTLWFDDKNKNGTIDSVDNDKVMLFFGLRRGGKSYYALDVTDPDNPQLQWAIHNKGDFNNLGFTWSRPKIAMMKTSKSAKKASAVLVFGGGYVDDNNGETDDSHVASDVYIVDAESGNKIWRVSENADYDTTYAVPGNVRVIDVDRNGIADRLYFANTGGQIWRIDLDEQDIQSKTKIYLFASLSDTSVKRKFFNEPDVAFFRHGGQYVMSIAIGSGERPNPLEQSNDDRFFVLFDKYPLKRPSNITIPALKMADLDDSAKLTSNKLGNASFKGWWLDLQATLGEKVLSSAITYENKVIFTTFGIGTNTVSANSCETSTSNEARLYVLDLFTGKPVLDLDKQSGKDASIVTAYGEIVETPQIFFPEMSGKSGGQCVKGNCVRTSKIVHGKSGNPVTSATPAILKRLPEVYWIDHKQK